MQKYKNVINECLIKAEQNVLVGDVVQLPELHLLIGVTNFYYKKLEKYGLNCQCGVMGSGLYMEGRGVDLMELIVIGS